MTWHQRIWPNELVKTQKLRYGGHGNNNFDPTISSKHKK